MHPKKHILVLVHGITPERDPQVTKQYEDFIAAVRAAKLPFEEPICEVSWGVPARDGSITRPDQFLTPAEKKVAALVELDEIETIDAREDELASGILNRDWGVPGLRQLSTRIRECVVQFGLADAVYYASPSGEKAIRDTVFEQVFANLDQNDDAPVELHIVAHSLGVTIAHDFLYALFGMHDPDYPHDEVQPEVCPLDAATKQRQDHWRDRARAGTLKLGTFISFASQLSLFLLRKQSLVERLGRGERLDPTVIGIDPKRQDVQWAIFFDADDVLGFATRRLYADTPTIRNIQVNSGVEPLQAHVGYWKKRKVIARCLEILERSVRRA